MECCGALGSADDVEIIQLQTNDSHLATMGGSCFLPPANYLFHVFACLEGCKKGQFHSTPRLFFQPIPPAQGNLPPEEWLESCFRVRSHPLEQVNV